MNHNITEPIKAIITRFHRPSLPRAGDRSARLWWNCPFHDDPSPSHCVQPGAARYRCFGCGAARKIGKRRPPRAGKPSHRRSPCPPFAHRRGRDGTDARGMESSRLRLAVGLNSLEMDPLDAQRRSLEDTGGNDRAGTRTQDQRINLPHRLSPTRPGG